jgi:hypothetical protein
MAARARPWLAAPARASGRADFLDLDLHERRERDVTRIRWKKKEEIRFDRCERKKERRDREIDIVGGWNGL